GETGFAAGPRRGGDASYVLPESLPVLRVRADVEGTSEAGPANWALSVWNRFAAANPRILLGEIGFAAGPRGGGDASYVLPESLPVLRVRGDLEGTTTAFPANWALG